MDPIHPIAPGPPLFPRAGTTPVERPERVSRERDRPPADQRERKRRPPVDTPHDTAESERPEDEGGHPHIDVRA